MAPSSEMEAYVNELLKKFERLKVLYEQYFMGIERIEPLTARKEVTRAILTLQQTPQRQSTLRFKVATLIQKWNLYQSYWNRTLREIEQGRYARHVALAHRRAVEKGVVFPAEEMGVANLLPHGSEGDPGAEAQPAEQSARTAPEATPEQASGPPAPPQPETPPRAARRPERQEQVPGLSEDDLRELHQRVVAAQRAAGEAQEMRYEALVTQLSRQVPRLLQEHGCNKVLFDVVTRDGRVKLKPSPQK